VSAQYFIQDGDVVLDDFEDGRIRFMARPVTLDTDAARVSMEKCLALRPRTVCPGHREPLLNADHACEAMQIYVHKGGT
jgi:hypothetical protein